MKRLALWLVVLMVALSCPAFASEPAVDGRLEDMRNGIVRDSYKLIDSYWKVLDLRYQFNELRGVDEDQLVKIYKAEMKRFEDLSTCLSARIIKTLREDKRIDLEFLSELYASKGVHEKPAFEVVVREILDFLKAEASAGRAIVDPALLDEQAYQENRATYFPGYGYSDPKYIYRKGLVVDDQTISTYWQEETKVWESNKKFEGIIDFKLAAELAATTSNFKKLSEPFKLDLGGHITVVIKVSFEVKESLTTKATKQYAVHRIWFELFRADRNYWSTPKWELCGKTYELRDEPTGMVATIGFKVNK